MELFNICVKKTYEKDGVLKVKWYKVGVLKIAESGKKYITLFQQPETEFYVFNNIEKEEAENS